MKNLFFLAAIVVAVVCVGCKSEDATTPPAPGAAAATPTGATKTGGNAMGAMGGAQLTDAGAGAEPGSKIK